MASAASFALVANRRNYGDNAMNLSAA